MATVTEIEQKGVSLEEALVKTSKYYFNRPFARQKI
jgi:hypothetical protein